MSGMDGRGPRNRDTIERELRVLAGVRDAYREGGGTMPSIDQMDALLDELIALRGPGRHRREDDTSGARPSLWR
jgi:hypothetical protein